MSRCVIIGTIHSVATPNLPSFQPGAVLERERTLKTALHYCAESGEGGVSSASVLLEAAPELVHAQDQDGYSALHLAVIAGNFPLAKLLISHRAPINMPDNEGHTPSHWATVCGEIECLELLLNSGGDPNIGDMHGGCPLHYAAQMCGPCSDMPADRRLGMASLRILLDNGADPNLPDNHGRQPILWAASAGGSEAILVLVTAGANVAAADKDGLTALHCAASRGHTDCVESLINLCNAEPDVIDNNGCSSLFYAVTLGHADATQALLNQGANTNRQDRKGRTAVHCGAAKGQLETLKVVAAWGGNLWQKTVRGDYPLHDAVSSGRRPLVLWLLAQRPDSVNCPNNDGRCPLHIAAIHNNIEMCETLLDAGSMVNPVMRTAKGALATPLDAALHKGHRGCAKYLQLHGGVPASRLNSESAALRGLSTSRGGETGRSSHLKLPKERVHDQLQAVDGPTLELRPEILRPSEYTQATEAFAAEADKLQKERSRTTLTTSTRPQILQVYVEDDLMIRRLRPHEGSDSSIEERVRRRRRKKKTALMAEREKSAPGRLHQKKVSSSDESVSSKIQTKSQDICDKVEKIVQTEFSVQPDSIQSQFEGMLRESTKDAHSLHVQFSEVENRKERSGSAREQTISSGESDKKRSIQIVEALVHKEGKSFESEEQEPSTKNGSKECSNEDENQVEQHNGTLNKESCQTPSKSNDDQLPIVEKIGDSDVIIDKDDQTTRDVSATTIVEGEPDQKEGKRLDDEVMNTTVNQEELELNGQKKTELSPESGEVLLNVQSGNNGLNASSTIPYEISTGEASADGGESSGNLITDGMASEDKNMLKTSEVTLIAEQHKNDKKEITEISAQSDGKEVPNDDLVAEVLLNSFQEDFNNVSLVDLPSQAGVSGRDEEMGNGIKSKTSGHEIPITKQSSRGEDETSNILKNELDPHDSEQVSKVESSSEKEAASSVATVSKVANSEDAAVRTNGQTVQQVCTQLEPLEGDVIKSGLEEQSKVIEENKLRDKDEVDLSNYSRDSLDMEASMDELPLNITKDSDDVPVEVGLPEPVDNVELAMPADGIEGTESDSIMTGLMNASSDRALIKVLGDPTGGLSDSVVIADKRKKLRKKREGNKRWMNTRSTESFEILKLLDDKTDEDVLFDADKTSDAREDSQSPMSKGEKSRRTPRGKGRTQRPCRKNKDSDAEPSSQSPVSITQAVQYSIRKYHLERRIFYQLLEVKRLQIRAGRASEAVLVKRLVDEHKRAGLMLGLQQYDGVYTFRSFEKFLYEQLRLLQTSERRIIPRLKSTDDLERLTAALRKTRAGQDILASVPNNPALCTYQTHRCHHATHAYTGVPCAAYITRPNHHTMPKPGGSYTGFLPKLVNEESAGEVAKTLRHVDPSRPLTLELSHGPDKQIIQLPTEKLDKSKKYFVTFTIKSGSNQEKGNLKHSHATSI